MTYSKLSPYEKEMKLLLDEILPDEPFIDNYRPDWLKNPATNRNLELDRYFPNLKIGFEFNGKQHRKKINQEQWERDKVKKKLCAKNKVIRFVVYKNELKKEILIDKLKDGQEMREAWAKGIPWKKDQ